MALFPINAMHTHEIPRVQRFHGRDLVRQTNRVVKLRRRIHAWFRGWRDGRSQLNGDSRTTDFLSKSAFIDKVNMHADAIGGNCSRVMSERRSLLEEALTKLGERKAWLDSQMQQKKDDAQGLRCETPEIRPSLYRWFLVPVALIEFAFSYLNLSESGLAGIPAELAISIGATAGMLWLSDLLGCLYRRFPLPRNEPRSALVKLTAEMLLYVVVILSTLLGLTYLRSLGGSSSSGFVEAALFTIGLVLLVAAVKLAGLTEYSGPKFGLAKMERQNVIVSDLIKSVESELKGMDRFEKHLSELLTSNKKRIAAIYSDKYRQHERRS